MPHRPWAAGLHVSLHLKCAANTLIASHVVCLFMYILIIALLISLSCYNSQFAICTHVFVGCVNVHKPLVGSSCNFRVIIRAPPGQSWLFNIYYFVVVGGGGGGSINISIPSSA